MYTCKQKNKNKNKTKKKKKKKKKNYTMKYLRFISSKYLPTHFEQNSLFDLTFSTT